MDEDLKSDSFYEFGATDLSNYQFIDYGSLDLLPPAIVAGEEGDDVEAEDTTLYAFKVVSDGDGTVSVTAGTVNTVLATGLTPLGKPTQLWLKVTLDANSVVTTAVVDTASSTDTATNTSRQIASITWNGDQPTIVQGIKGSQNLVSCGAQHGWSSLYL